MVDSLFNKVTGVNVMKFVRTAFFIENLWWMLLNFPFETQIYIIFVTKTTSAVLQFIKRISEIKLIIKINAVKPFK